MNPNAIAVAQAMSAELRSPELEELSALIGWGSAAFYLAESDHNPRVSSYWDALHYIAASLSVGYANIFPVTAAGKIIGSIVMTFGPALCARVFDRREPASGALADLGPIVERLDAILSELQRVNQGRDSRSAP